MIAATLSETILARLCEHAAARFGLDFPRSRWPDLERGVRAAYDERQDTIGIDAFIEHILAHDQSDSELQPLIRHLTVGETYFLREKRSLGALCEQILPHILQAQRGNNRQIRVWSAGCATGEEPYSLAIMLERLVPEARNVTIVGSDLNASFIERAITGVYGEWSFRESPPWLKNGYFEALSNHRWTVTPRIRNRVRFRTLNLMENVYPSLLNETQDLDLILCRNVLMYCTRRATQEILTRLYRCLADAGWLMVGTAEVGMVAFAGFDRVSFGDIAVYRKKALGRVTIETRGAVSTLIAEGASGRDAVYSASSHVTSTGSGPGADASREERELSHEQALERYRCGDYENAERIGRALLSRNSQDSQAALLLTRLYANAGKISEALDCCNQVLTTDKMSTVAYYLRALILQEQGSFDEAASSLQRAIYTDPCFVMGHFALGNLTSRHTFLGDPCKHYENALALLSRCAPDEVVPESDGMSVREMRKIVLQNSRRKHGYAVGSRLRKPQN